MSNKLLGTPQTAGEKPEAQTTPLRNNTSDHNAASASRKQTGNSSKLQQQSNGLNGSNKSLSKSHDNLASTLRKKAISASLAANKENVKERPPSASSSSKFKTPKGSPMRKAYSSQSIDKSEATIKRAQSAQNVSNSPSVKTKGACSVKKASSTQNISQTKDSAKCGGGVAKQVRIATPSNIMAYNAELLASFEKEKRALERRISELIQVAETRRTDIERYKFEVRNLREQVPSAADDGSHQVEQLLQENKELKDRLRDLGDDEGHGKQDKRGSGEERAESVDSSRRLPDAGSDPSLGELSFMTADHPSSLALSLDNWDKKSDKSSDAMSEVSVACLQDRIMQMEETHYCTSEELQATLQELSDLQDTVNHLSLENEKLADEKQVLLESLCAQTEKLQNCRMQVGQIIFLSLLGVAVSGHTNPCD